VGIAYSPAVQPAEMPALSGLTAGHCQSARPALTALLRCAVVRAVRRWRWAVGLVRRRLRGSCQVLRSLADTGPPPKKTNQKKASPSPGPSLFDAETHNLIDVGLKFSAVFRFFLGGDIVFRFFFYFLFFRFLLRWLRFSKCTRGGPSICFGRPLAQGLGLLKGLRRD
jgi:hypothetical protein